MADLRTLAFGKFTIQFWILPEKIIFDYLVNAIIIIIIITLILILISTI